MWSPTVTAESTLRDLYDRHWVGLVRLAGLLLGSTDAAEEVVQDAYVAIFRRINRFADAGDAYGYLRTSVVNGCRSVHRHRAVVNRKPVLDDATPTQPDEVALRHESDEQMMAAIRTLPQRQQEVLVLRYYADASEAEIADTLGISRGAVKSHAHRGVHALRVQLAGSVGPGADGSGAAHGR
jgi:RNA polymerase sigma-70 factor (sigma-E family)